VNGLKGFPFTAIHIKGRSYRLKEHTRGKQRLRSKQEGFDTENKQNQGQGGTVFNSGNCFTIPILFAAPRNPPPVRRKSSFRRSRKNPLDRCGLPCKALESPGANLWVTTFCDSIKGSFPRVTGHHHGIEFGGTQILYKSFPHLWLAREDVRISHVPKQPDVPRLLYNFIPFSLTNFFSIC
jgi:hypothetical protein